MKIIDKIKKTVRFNLRLFLATHKIPLIMYKIPYLQYFEVTGLNYKDPVHIKLPTKTLNYYVYAGENRYFLNNTEENNDRIFYVLGIDDKHSFVKKIVGYDTTGAFPEVKSKEDLLKVIVALDGECIKKFGGENAISSDLKVGDRVVVLPRVKNASLYSPWYSDAMTPYAGKLAVITEICRSGSYKLDIDESHYYWPKEALKLSDEVIYKEASKQEFKSELSMLPRKKKHYQLDFNIH